MARMAGAADDANNSEISSGKHTSTVVASENRYGRAVTRPANCLRNLDISTRTAPTRDGSVTNKWNQTWDVPNLFVVDGSSLTTGGAVNPTSTIGALAVRAGDYISQRFADIVDQRTTPSNADAPAI
jgi:hypothetical protein